MEKNNNEKFVIGVRPVGIDGRVNIPQQIRDVMKLEKGDQLLFAYNKESKELILSKVSME